MEKHDYLTVMMVGFVAIIFGVVVVTTIADQTQTTTSLVFHNDTLNLATAGYKNATGSINETKTYTLLYPSSAQWRKDSAVCAAPALTITFNNGTDLKLTATTHYTYDSAASTVLFKNVQPINSTGIGANITYLTYNQCPDGYQTEGWTRTVYNMVPGFFALGILGISLFVAKKLLDKMGTD